MTDNSSVETDRRQSVRVLGRNLFYYKPVSREKFALLQKDFDAGIPLYNHEGLADIQMFIGAQSALSRIRERDSDLGDFLAHLDSKINLLLKKASGSKTILDNLTLEELDLSGRGLSFIAEHKIEVDDILEFHIALLPSYTYIYCFGQVLSCQEQPRQEGGPASWKVAAEFVLIMEDDQEKLIQHNFKQQSIALRNRRLRGG
jgi:hypothetical protein